MLKKMIPFHGEKYVENQLIQRIVYVNNLIVAKRLNPFHEPSRSSDPELEAITQRIVTTLVLFLTIGNDFLYTEMLSENEKEIL
jgi:hypothetical protein